VFDRDIPANDEARLLESFEERRPDRRFGLRRAVAEIPDDRQRPLRGSFERRQRGHARYASLDVAASHSMTSSARAILSLSVDMQPGQALLGEDMPRRGRKPLGLIEGADMEMRFSRQPGALASQGRTASRAKSAP